jgi:hypothetical protein
VWSLFFWQFGHHKPERFLLPSSIKNDLHHPSQQHCLWSPEFWDVPAAGSNRVPPWGPASGPCPQC